MTAGELIERLKQFPSDMPVVDYLYDHVYDVELSKADDNCEYNIGHDIVRLMS